MTPLERLTVDVGGVPVAVWQAGSGVPIFVVHGLAIDHRGIATTIEAVAATRDGHRRIYVDLPGMGATPARPHLVSASALLDVLDEVIEAVVGSEPFLVVGQSYGGHLIRGVIARRPEQVLGAAFVVPVVEPDPARRRLPSPAKHRIDDEAMETLPVDFLEEFRPLIVIESPDVAAGIARDILPALVAGDQAFLEKLQEEAYGLEAGELGGVFHGPTLVVCGRHDAVVGFEDALELHAMFPRATIAVLDAAGHVAELEQPAVVQALLSDWLDRVATTT